MMSKTYFNETEVIRTIMDFNHAEGANENAFNVAYGIDKNFLFGCGVSIASVLLSNPSYRFVFHVFTDSFSDEDRRKFDALAAQYKTHISVYLIDCEKLKSLPSTKNWTYAIYFRFIIFDYFADRLDRILYLDADIVCQNSVDELFNLDFCGHVCAVVAEGEAPWWKKRAEALRRSGIENGYFNTGFLFVDLHAWKSESITLQAIEMLQEPEVAHLVSFPDQDVLNMIFEGNILFLDKKYNTQFSLNYELKKKGSFVVPINEHTVFIHYIGPTKPWHNWAVYESAKSFFSAKSHSPWKEYPLLMPVNSNQYRYCAKHMANQGKLWRSVCSYTNYYIAKLKKK